MIIYLFILFWVTLTREVCFVLGLSIKDFFLPRAKVVTARIPNEKKMIVRHQKEEPKGTIGVLQIFLSFDIPLRIRYFVTNVLSVVWG